MTLEASRGVYASEDYSACFFCMSFAILPIDIITMNDFSVWLRTGSNPADINRFQSHNGKQIATCMYSNSTFQPQV